MTATNFLRAGAREILRGIAWDMAIIYRERGAAANCKALWEDAKRIERRFKLSGMTSFELSSLEFRATYNSAVTRLKRLAATRYCERTEIERMSGEAAKDDLRDLVNTLGRLGMAERIGGDSYKTACELI